MGDGLMRPSLWVSLMEVVNIKQDEASIREWIGSLKADPGVPAAKICHKLILPADYGVKLVDILRRATPEVRQQFLQELNNAGMDIPGVHFPRLWSSILGNNTRGVARWVQELPITGAHERVTPTGNLEIDHGSLLPEVETLQSAFLAILSKAPPPMNLVLRGELVRRGLLLFAPSLTNRTCKTSTADSADKKNLHLMSKSFAQHFMLFRKFSYESNAREVGVPKTTPEEQQEEKYKENEDALSGPGTLESKKCPSSLDLSPILPFFHESIAPVHKHVTEILLKGEGKMAVLESYCAHYMIPPFAIIKQILSHLSSCARQLQEYPPAALLEDAFRFSMQLYVDPERIILPPFCSLDDEDVTETPSLPPKSTGWAASDIFTFWLLSKLPPMRTLIHINSLVPSEADLVMAPMTLIRCGSSFFCSDAHIHAHTNLRNSPSHT